jgi:hypothetical protein
MDGYRGVLEFQPYATSLPNGTANTRGLASPHKVSGFKAGRAGTRIFAVGDHTRVWARIACQRPNTENGTSKGPRRRGPFSESLCDQRFEGLHGGGRSRSRTGLRFPNSLLTGKLTGILLEIADSVRF